MDHDLIKGIVEMYIDLGLDRNLTVCAGLPGCQFFDQAFCQHLKFFKESLLQIWLTCRNSESLAPRYNQDFEEFFLPATSEHFNRKASGAELAEQLPLFPSPTVGAPKAVQTCGEPLRFSPVFPTLTLQLVEL